MVQSNKANFDLHTITQVKEIWSLCLSFWIWIIHIIDAKIGLACVTIFSYWLQPSTKDPYSWRNTKGIYQPNQFCLHKTHHLDLELIKMWQNFHFDQTHYKSLNKFDQQNWSKGNCTLHCSFFNVTRQKFIYLWLLQCFLPSIGRE